MKIKCISNTISNRPEYFYLNDYYKLKAPCDRLIMGKEYTVYAVTEIYEFTWYCICDENYSYYPMWYPFSMFEITNQSLSRYWTFSLRERLSKTQTVVFSPLLAYSEWAAQDDYYDQLTDGEEPEGSIFKRYKALMDLEFSDKSITEIAQIGDADWLICPSCIEAWNCPNDQDGMVTCPQCKKIMHNPRYHKRIVLLPPNK